MEGHPIPLRGHTSLAVRVQDPITGHIIEAIASFSAVDMFRALYRLESLRAQRQLLWERAGCLIVPTTPTFHRIDAAEAEPICPNTQLGMYTNFVTPLDLVAVAAPSGFRVQGLPMSVTLIAPALHDDLPTSIAPAFQHRSGLRLGDITHTRRRFPLAFSGWPEYK